MSYWWPSNLKLFSIFQIKILKFLNIFFLFSTPLGIIVFEYLMYPYLILLCIIWAVGLNVHIIIIFLFAELKKDKCCIKKGTLNLERNWMNKSYVNEILKKILNIFYWLYYYICPIFPPLFPSAMDTPSHPHSLPFNSRPCIMHVSSLASTFRTLFLTSPCLYSTYHLC